MISTATKTLRTASISLLLAASLAGQLAQANPIPLDVTILDTQIYNDRIGYGRFFSGANSDRIRISAYVTPSRDSDAAGVSTNGSDTLVSFSHAVLNGQSRSMSYVGPASLPDTPSGGGLNEFVNLGANLWNLANPFVQAKLAALDTTPFVITAYNPQAQTTQTVSHSQLDYDPTALPEFVRNMRLTPGLEPTIEWAMPTSGTTPSNVSLQIRHIDSESVDKSRITHATLVQHINLPAGTTSHQVPAGLLTMGHRYEIAVQLDARDTTGELKGRSRSFFEFTPLTDGAGAVAVFLPSVDGAGKRYKFDINVEAGKEIALDPIVAVGYDYQIGAGDPLFASVMLPDIGDGLYELYLFDGQNWVLKTGLQAGEQFFFDGKGVDRFRVLGIETAAGLDPNDPTAFITTVSFADKGRFTGTMTPITEEIPEPGTLLLVAAGLLATGARRFRIAPHTSGAIQ